MRNNEIEQPFESIESAHEFMVLLAASIEEAVRDVRKDRDVALDEEEERRVQALDLALYKLKLLDTHVVKSRRILNDLRAIRRLLFNERSAAVW
jgi:hypothetical protein